MPIYEYRCGNCGKAMSKFWRSLSAIDEKILACPSCGSRKLGRMVSRVRVIRGGGGDSDVGPAGDMDESLMREMENVDENDPRALGRLMRKMAASAGEDLGEEFNEVVGRLEKGEDPERIEKEMGDVFGGEGEDGMGSMDGMGGMGMDDEMMPAPPAVEAEPTEPKNGAASKRVVRGTSAIPKKTSNKSQKKPQPSKPSKKARR
jgi:putative FmdB family regulatory protein